MYRVNKISLSLKDDVDMNNLKKIVKIGILNKILNKIDNRSLTQLDFLSVKLPFDHSINFLSTQ